MSSGTNPFRSNRPSETTVSQSSDANDSITNINIKVEVSNPSPSSSQTAHDARSLKRKHKTDSEWNSSDEKTDNKKRKISEDDANLGKKKNKKNPFYIFLRSNKTFILFVFASQVKETKKMLQVWMI